MSLTKAVSLIALSFALLWGCVPPKRPVEVPVMPPEERERILRGLQAYKEGRFREAIKDLEVARRAGPPLPEFEEGLYALGMAYFKKGEYERAKGAFTEFLERYPTSFRRKEVRLYLLKALRETGDLQGALPLAKGLLQEALSPQEKKELLWFLARESREADPLEALGYYQALLDLGEKKARDEALEVIYRLKPKELQEVAKGYKGDFRPYALLLLAHHWIKAGDTDKAQGLLEKVRGEAEARGFGRLWEAVWFELLERVGKEVKIGLLLPLSGRLAQKGRSLLQGVLLGAGILGPGRVPYKVQLLIEDWAKGEEALKGLKEAKAVLALIPEGSKAPPGAIDADPPLEKEEIGALLEAARKEGIGALTVLYPADQKGSPLATLVQEKAKELGLKTVFKAYPPRTRDFGPVLKELKESMGLLDGLLFVGDGEDLCLVSSQLAYLDLRRRVLGLRISDPKRLTSLCGRYLDGALITSPFYPFSSKPEVQAFLEAFKETFQRDPDPLAFRGYAMVRSVLEGKGMVPPVFLLRIEDGRIREIP